MFNKRTHAILEFIAASSAAFASPESWSPEGAKNINHLAQFVSREFREARYGKNSLSQFSASFEISHDPPPSPPT